MGTNEISQLYRELSMKTCISGVYWGGGGVVIQWPAVPWLVKHAGFANCLSVMMVLVTSERLLPRNSPGKYSSKAKS